MTAYLRTKNNSTREEVVAASAINTGEALPFPTLVLDDLIYWEGLDVPGTVWDSNQTYNQLRTMYEVLRENGFPVTAGQYTVAWVDASVDCCKKDVVIEATATPDVLVTQDMVAMAYGSSFIKAGQSEITFGVFEAAIRAFREAVLAGAGNALTP
jgi:hypothetical protein